jgi:quinol monooxygenase YgiN
MQAYRPAEALEASEHCERYEVTRCSEDPTQHIVRIEWDSEEGHLSGFRQSPEFRSFFEAVGPFVHDIEEMRHYQVTLSSTDRARACPLIGCGGDHFRVQQLRFARD